MDTRLDTTLDPITVGATGFWSLARQETKLIDQWCPFALEQSASLFDHKVGLMATEFDLPLILRLFPECPRVEQQPSVDAIVCEYLRQHDVEVNPVSSNIQPSALTNAAMGAIGADALAANTHLTVQQRSVALQEWTSWKQWAISQPDFKDFKRNALEKSEAAQKRQDKWLLENEARIQVKVESYRLEEREEKLKDQRFAMTILAGGVALIFVLGGAIMVVDMFSPSSSVPTKSRER